VRALAVLALAGFASSASIRIADPLRRRSRRILPWRRARRR